MLTRPGTCGTLRGEGGDSQGGGGGNERGAGAAPGDKASWCAFRAGGQRVQVVGGERGEEGAQGPLAAASSSSFSESLLPVAGTYRAGDTVGDPELPSGRRSPAEDHKLGGSGWGREAEREAQDGERSAGGLPAGCCGSRDEAAAPSITKLECLGQPRQQRRQAVQL